MHRVPHGVQMFEVVKATDAALTTSNTCNLWETLWKQLAYFL